LQAIGIMGRAALQQPALSEAEWAAIKVRNDSGL
jgi:hypothetical protein